MAKRCSDLIKTWWELEFDESAYKFRKLLRHHHEPEAAPVLPARQDQGPADGVARAQPQQDVQAADVDMVFN
jgi:hypothetical protein